MNDSILIFAFCSHYSLATSTKTAVPARQRRRGTPGGM